MEAALSYFKFSSKVLYILTNILAHNPKYKQKQFFRDRLQTHFFKLLSTDRPHNIDKDSLM